MTKSHSEFPYQPAVLTEGVPLYFVRTWGGRNDQPPLPHPPNVFDTRTYFPDVPLTIYGFSIVSEYDEDQDTAWRVWKNRRAFLSFCYSEIVPDGEMGFTEADEVVEISEEEFLAARDRDWRLP